MMKKGLATFALSMAAAFSAYALEPELVSVKHSGMGGAGVALPQDALSIVLNPASSAHLCNRFDVGVHWKWTENEFSTVTGTTPILSTYRNHDRHIVHPDFAVNYWLGCDISFGLSFHNSFYQKNRFNSILGGLGLTDEFEQKLVFETITPVLAWRFCNCHTIGIGLPIYIGAYKNSGLELLEGESSIDLGSLTNRGWDRSVGWGINLGYLLQVTPNLDVGIFYQPKVSIKRFNHYRGFLADQGRVDIPETIRAGLVYKADCWNIAFDVEQRNYSELAFWGNNGLGGLVGGIFGEADGPGLGWSNQTLFRLGGDYRWSDCWVFRAGYEQSTNHAHGQDSFIGGLFGKAVTSTVSVGATYNLACNQELSVYYAHGFERTIKNDSLGVDLPIVGPLLQVQAKEQSNYLGVSYGMSF
jgi:long-chain fatty acid transport protein